MAEKRKVWGIWWNKEKRWGESGGHIGFYDSEEHMAQDGGWENHERFFKEFKGRVELRLCYLPQPLPVKKGKKK